MDKKQEKRLAKLLYKVGCYQTLTLSEEAELEMLWAKHQQQMAAKAHAPN